MSASLRTDELFASAWKRCAEGACSTDSISVFHAPHAAH
jgi:hypothetical protein